LGQDSGDPVGDAFNFFAQSTASISGNILNITKSATGAAGLINEGLGEITGRNQARKQNFFLQDQINEEKSAKQQSIKDEQLRKQQEDIAASSFIGAVRSTGEAKKANSLGYSTKNPSQDFLGI
jgi:hypothetical protein